LDKIDIAKKLSLVFIVSIEAMKNFNLKCSFTSFYMGLVIKHKLGITV